MLVKHKFESKSEIDDDIETVINMTNRNGKNIENKKKMAAQNASRKKQKKKKRIKRIIKWASIIILIIAGIIFALTSPIFNIQEIKVENNKVLTQERIISLSGLNKGENIFRFLKSDVEMYIKEEPYVESVEISRQLPSIVKINVKERNRDFCVRMLNSYAYINNQGYILEITQDTLELPVIDGIQTPEEEIQVGKRLNNNDLKKLEIAIQIMSVAKENEIAEKITGIDISDKNEYILYLAKDNKTVYIGNSSELNTKFLYIKKMLDLESGKEGTFFVNGDFSKNFKPFFRDKV